jgi:hypothetical protein
MMVLATGMAAKLAVGLVNGPLMKIIEAHVADQALRRKLAAEMEQQVLAHLTRSAELGQAVVMAEVQSEHWLSRSWRPMLMLLLMGFLLLAGLVLPLADVIAGGPVPFQPRWNMLPQGFWDFLAIGMGGYIGGRSLEKVAGAVAAVAERKPPPRKRR